MRATIVSAARACLGTPFRHQGRVPGVGLDCAGLAVVALRAAGVEVRDLPSYSRTPHDGRLKAVVDMQPGLRPSRAGMQPGDLIILRIGAEPSHLAICTEQGIIHAYEQVGRVVEHRLDDRWAAQVVAVYRAEGAE